MSYEEKLTLFKEMILFYFFCDVKEFFNVNF